MTPPRTELFSESGAGIALKTKPKDIGLDFLARLEAKSKAALAKNEVKPQEITEIDFATQLKADINKLRLQKEKEKQDSESLEKKIGLVKRKFSRLKEQGRIDSRDLRSQLKADKIILDKRKTVTNIFADIKHGTASRNKVYIGRL